MAKRPIIIDTDAGNGFAHAAMLISGCGLFDIKGICTVSGSVSAVQAASCCAWLEKLTGMEAPVVTGSDKALIVRRDGSCRSDSGGIMEKLMGPVQVPASAEHPWDLIYRTAVELEGELELFCTGPLTNIATAVLRHRDLPQYIKRVTIAAGSSRAGDSTVYAEFNVYSDPHAFKCVLDAGFRRVDLVDLEFARTVCLDAQTSVRFHDLPDSNPWKPFLEEADRERVRKLGDPAYIKREGSSGELRVHDAAAAFVLAIPAAVTSSDVYTMVELRSEMNSGRTLFDFRKRFTDDPNVKLAVYTSREMFTDFYMRCVHAFDRRAVS